jgi:hypothetical protein
LCPKYVGFTATKVTVPSGLSAHTSFAKKGKRRLEEECDEGEEEELYRKHISHTIKENCKLFQTVPV